MTEVGLGKLEQPDFTASARAGTPALVVIAERSIPAILLASAASEAGPPGVARRSQTGRRYPGTQLSNPHPVLTVRTK